MFNSIIGNVGQKKQISHQEKTSSKDNQSLNSKEVSEVDINRSNDDALIDPGATGGTLLLKNS